MNFIIPQHLHINNFLNLLLLLLLISFSISTNLFGQVVIEEKIEIITPYKSNLKKSINTIASVSQTVRFEIDWDKSHRDGFIRVIYPSSMSDNYTAWTSGGSLSLTVGGFIAPVNIMFQYKVNLGAYEPSLVNYRMFVDDELVKSGSSTLTGGWTSIPYRNVTYFLAKKLETILYVKADFETETLSTGDTVNVIVKKVDEEGNESNFNSITIFEVGLEEGCGIGYILDAAGQPQDYIPSIEAPIRFVVNDNLTEADTLIKLRVGVPDGVDTVYKPYDEFPLLPKLSPGASAKKKSNKEPLSALESEYCTAIFNHSGYGTAKGTIQSAEVDSFTLSIIPDTLSVKDTLAFAEGATLSIQAVDSSGNNVFFDENKMLKLSITGNNEYLRIVNETGDTLSEQTNEIEKTYSVFNNNIIRIVAIDENPETLDSCMLKVMSIEDTSISGENTAVILEHTLRIDMPGEHEVQPIITGMRYDDVDENNTYLSNIDEDNRKPFSIILKRGGEVVDTHKIKLTTDYIDGSGGHDHIPPARARRGNTSERMKRQNYGSFFSYNSGETFNTDSLNGMEYERAEEDTVTRFEYVASIWGDSMKIKLTSLENPLLKDSLIIVEKIPDLEALDTNENYTLIGGTDEHNGPQSSQVDHNHYGTESTNSNLRRIAADYHQQFQEMLIINDMSLPYGGKFDILGEWRDSHYDHREGSNVDIRSRDMEGDRFIDRNNNGIFDPDPENNPIERLLRDNNENGQYDGGDIEVFRRFCRNNNATRILLEYPEGHGGGPEHWHLEF